MGRRRMKVFLVAGELSGDALGGALMEGLKRLVPDVTWRGVGGPQMMAHGLPSLFPMQELSVMGLAEILPKYAALKRRLNETIDAVLAFSPDVLITIDSPDFSLRVAKAVKSRSQIRTVHYVAPTVWAWRPKRAECTIGFAVPRAEEAGTSPCSPRSGDWCDNTGAGNLYQAAFFGRGETRGPEAVFRAGGDHHAPGDHR